MIECKAKAGNGMGTFFGGSENIFVSVEGDVTPCCWLGTVYGRSQIENLPNIYEQDITEIKFDFDVEQIDICQQMCGKNA